jgi:hypothetical protein
MLKSKINNGQKVLNPEKRKQILQIFTFYILLFAFPLIFTNAVCAQRTVEFPEYIPPPKIELSKDEKTSLEGEKDVKKYTNLAIDFMELRLNKAEDLANSQSFNDVLQELGGFHALMNTTLQFLNRNNTGNRKILTTYKRFELALRSFMPRLETIRREMPERHEIYVVKLLNLVRDGRTKAVEPLFADTVVPNDDN